MEGFGTSCTFDYISKDFWDRVFIIILITGGFLIPLFVILISYTIILIKLSQRGRSLTTTKGEGHDSHPHSTPLSTYYFNHLQLPSVDVHSRISVTPSHEVTSEDSNISRNIRRTEARATRTALLILTVFCCAWGPYALMALVSMFGWNDLVNAYTTSILGIFTKFAACINPLIYALSLRGFREQICSYVKCLFRCELKDQRLLNSHPEPHRSPMDLHARHRTQSNSFNRLNVV